MQNATISADFDYVRQAYNDYMFHEAAERGYDAQAARAANEIYMQRAEDFKRKHGQSWTEYEAEQGTVAEGQRIMKVSVTAQAAPGALVASAPAIGHNNPPLDAEGEYRRRIAEEHAELIERAEKLAGGKPKDCEDDEYAERLTTFVKKLATTAADLEKLRKREVEPHLKGQRMVNGYFNTIIETLDKTKRAANLKLTAYLRKKEEAEAAARREAAAQLQREADAQRKAQEALWDAGRPMEAGEAGRAADKIEKHAEKVEAAAYTGGASLAQVRTGAASSSLRRRTVAEIVDRQALDLEALRPYIPADALQRALNAYVAATKATELRGAKIYETTEASVR